MLCAVEASVFLCNKTEDDHNGVVVRVRQACGIDDAMRIRGDAEMMYPSSQIVVVGGCHSWWMR